MLLQAHMPIVAVPAMYWRRTFPGRADQARAVRAFVAALLPDRPCLDEVLLAVDELVVNALRHTKSGQGGRFSVHVRDAAGRTAISVGDEGGPAEPVAGDAGELDESGRGLRTVRSSRTAGAGTATTTVVRSPPCSGRIPRTDVIPRGQRHGISSRCALPRKRPPRAHGFARNDRAAAWSLGRKHARVRCRWSDMKRFAVPVAAGVVALAVLLLGCVVFVPHWIVGNDLAGAPPRSRPLIGSRP
jgi:serine/threonine-protein kinase RsbW